MNLKFHFQDIQKSGVHLIFHFQTDHLTPLTFFQLFLNFHQKILSLILINGKICITHNSVWMRTDHIIAQKQLINVSFDDLLQKSHCCMAFLLRRDDHHSRKYGRDLHCSKINLFFAFFCIFFGKECSNVQCLVPDQRKRSGGVHSHRCEDRIYIILKILIHELFLFLGKCLMFKDHMKSGFLQGRNQRPV